MFDKTPINPELVQSIDQVYALRTIATQFFVDQRIQKLTMETDVERARLIVALVDVLKRSNRLGKVLILSQLTKILEQIETSFSLHTSYALDYLGKDKNLSQVNFVTYRQFFKLFGYDDKTLAHFFNQFDLIIVDNIEDERNEIFKRKLAWHSHWVLEVNVPITHTIAM